MTSPRYLFGAGAGDFAIAPPSRHGGFVVAATDVGNGTFWTARTGGTQHTDLQTVNGGTMPFVRTDKEGSITPFYGPEGVYDGWLDFGGGDRVYVIGAGIVVTAADATILAQASADSASASRGAAESAAASASASAASAQNAANLVSAPADTAIATAVSGAGTQTRGALDGRYVKKGDLVFNVNDYGAKGDGSTDDTAAIQSAADAACAARGMLYFPAGTFMVNPAATNASGTGVCLVNLTGPVHLRISRHATVRVMSSTSPFVTIFGATNSLVNMTGFMADGGGTIDCNSAARRAAHVVPNTTTPCVGIGRMNIGVGIKVTNLRFTQFDSVWCVAFSSSAPGNMSNVEVSHCLFDNLGTTTAADKHDFSAVYIDAIGIHLHNNDFWQGAPGSQTYVTNYGVRTAIELHGSGQNCHHNNTYGMQWGGNLWMSMNSWLDVDAAGSKNSTGIAWSDNNFNHCAVGINLGGGSVSGTDYGLSGVRVHHNNITVDPTLWNVDTGGGAYASGVLIASGLPTGSFTGIDISNNDIRITPNNTAMNSFTWTVSPAATPSAICVVLLNTNTTILRDWNISNNTVRGSLQDGIHLAAYSYEGLTITGNRAINSHLAAGGTGFAFYVVTNGTVPGTNNLNNLLMALNHCVDEQNSTFAPYGYTGPTESGVLYCSAGSASNAQILDNGYHCKNGATLSVAQGFTGNPAPLLRAFDHNATFTPPTGLWAAGSTVTTTTQRNSAAPTAAVWVQTGNSNGIGSTWQRRPTFSGVVTKTAAYTAITGDVVLGDPTSAAFTVTLPAVQPGATVSIKNVGTVNSISVSTTASKLIDGVSTASLTPGQKANYVSDGSNWYSV